MEFRHQSFSETVSALNGLFSQAEQSPLEGVETRSDLLEALAQRAGDWSAYADRVIDCISKLIPQSDLADWLAAVESSRRTWYKRLAQTLLAAGVPVISDSGVFQRVLPEGDQADRFFRGDRVYGFTCQGKVFLNADELNPEAPLHEYAHLWATALRVANPTEWEHVVQLMRGTAVWQELSDRYQGSLSGDRLAEEVVATYSGRWGTERLQSAGLSGWDRVVSALQSFWRGVCGLVGIHFSSAEQVADRVLRDFVSAVNPEELLLNAEMKDQYSELNAPARQLFMGEKGAAELDASALFSARVDCLHAAERMEAAGREPKQIKLATGWERGVDGFWRYELPAVSMKEFSWDKQAWRKGFRLGALIDAPDLFNAYPELSALPVSAQRMRSAAIFESKSGIKINVSSMQVFRDWVELGYPEKALSGLQKSILHEVQHWIQDQEGFGMGGDAESIKDKLMDRDLMVLKEQDRLAFLFRNYFAMNSQQYRWIITQTKARIISTAHEYLDNHPNECNRNAELRELADYLSKLDNDAYRVFLIEVHTQIIKVEKLEKKAQTQSKEIYRLLSGEVEARNVEKRIQLSESERKGSLAVETMDTPAEEQYLKFSQDLPTKVGSVRAKR